MESSRKSHKHESKSKLKKKEILKFYSIVKAAALRGEQGPLTMISDNYYQFLHNVLNSHHNNSLNLERLVAQIKSLKDKGFFEVEPNKLDSKTLDLIIKDIQTNGADIKAIIKRSDDNSAAKNLIDRLDNQKLTISGLGSGKSAPDSLATGFTRLVINKKESESEKKISKNLSTEDNLEYRWFSLRYLISLNLKNGNELAKKGFFLESIGKYHSAIQATHEIYMDVAKQVGPEKIQQLKAKDESLAEIHRQLAKAYHNFAMQTWNSDPSNANLNNVIDHINSAIHVLEQVSVRTADDEEWLNVYRRHEAKALIARGEKYFSEKNFEEALTNFQEVIEKSKSEPELKREASIKAAVTLGWLSMDERRKKDFVYRIENLKKGIEIFLNLTLSDDERTNLNALRRHLYQILNERGLNYLEQDHEKAIDLFQEALDVLKKIDPKSEMDHTYLSKIENNIRVAQIAKEPFRPIQFVKPTPSSSPIIRPITSRPQVVRPSVSPLNSPIQSPSISRIGSFSGSGFTAFSKIKREEDAKEKSKGTNEANKTEQGKDDKEHKDKKL